MDATFTLAVFFFNSSRRRSSCSIADRIKTLRFPLPCMTESIHFPVPFGNRIIVISNPSGGRPMGFRIADASVIFHPYRITDIDKTVDGHIV